jgi:hypothetical protein
MSAARATPNALADRSKAATTAIPYLDVMMHLIGHASRAEAGALEG